jgi:hypothetical protein
MSIYGSSFRSSYMRLIFKFWETLTRNDHKIANNLVLFEDTLNEDVSHEGWLLLISVIRDSLVVNRVLEAGLTRP